jgi:hypothetical protein
MPRGGHFAAMEQPELLVEDIRAFFRPFRSDARAAVGARQTGHVMGLSSGLSPPSSTNAACTRSGSSARIFPVGGHPVGCEVARRGLQRHPAVAPYRAAACKGRGRHRLDHAGTTQRDHPMQER